MNATNLIVILDRSGSMLTIKTDIEGGFDQFMLEQSNLDGECYVTLAQFDSEGIDTVFSDLSVDQVPPLDLKPRGMTPLLDAIGRTVAQFDDRFKDDKPDRVMVVIITDGQENWSQEYTLDSVKQIIERHEKDGWKFVYLGANVDAFAEAGSMGVAQNASMGYVASSDGVSNMYGAASAAVTDYRRGGRGDIRK